VLRLGEAAPDTVCQPWRRLAAGLKDGGHAPPEPALKLQAAALTWVGLQQPLERFGLAGSQLAVAKQHDHPGCGRLTHDQLQMR